MNSQRLANISDHCQRYGSALLATAISLSAGNTAALTFQEVSDDALSQMRGRFVQGNQIVHFGVKMTSHWNNINGLAHDVAMNIQINRNNPFQPNFSVDVKGTDLGNPVAHNNVRTETPSAQENAPLMDNQGIDNIEGVAQSIQVTGNNNAVDNRMSINVSDRDLPSQQQQPSATAPNTTPSAPVNTPTVASTTPETTVSTTDSKPDPDSASTVAKSTATISPQPGNRIAMPGTMASSTTTLVNGAGVKTTISLNQQHLGYTVEVPGQGLITQGLLSSAGVKQLTQRAQISGNHNSVLNNLQLTVGVAPTMGGTAVDLRGVLSSLRGLPF